MGLRLGTAIAGAALLAMAPVAVVAQEVTTDDVAVDADVGDGNQESGDGGYWGLLGLLGCLVLTIGNFPTLIGGSTGLALGIGAVLVTVTAVGVVLGLVRRDATPDTPGRADTADRPVTPRENA